MTLLIHDTTVVTADDDAQVLFGAAVAIDGDRIVDVGLSDEVAAKHLQAERVDGRGKMVMPGFANCHTHFTLTISRGIEEDYSFPSTLRLPKSVQEYLTPEDRSVLAQLGALESIRSGTTAAFEIGRNLADYAGDLVGSGLRLLLGESAIDLDQAAARDGVFDYNDALGEASLQRIEDLYSAFDGAGNGRIRVSAAAHAPEAVSPSFLPRVREMSERFGTPSTIHLNQSWWEVEAVKNVRGVLPTEYLSLHDFLWPDLIAAHCRCMATPEIQLLGRSGATASFNSAIAARRGYSPRIGEIAAAGSPIAMGSDNMAEDMIEVMRTGLFMERVRTGDGERPTPEQAVRWATANGNRALGFTGSGVIEAGNKADLIIVDTQRAHLVPSMRVLSGFVHQGTPADVQSVMVDGEWLMRDGAVLTLDEAGIVAEAEVVGRRAWGRLIEEFPDAELPINLDTRQP